MVPTETRSPPDHIKNAVGSVVDWSVDGWQWVSYLGDLASSRTQWRQLVVKLSRSSQAIAMGFPAALISSSSLYINETSNLV